MARVSRIKLCRAYRFMRRQVARVEWMMISAYARWILICMGEDPLVESLKTKFYSLRARLSRDGGRRRVAA